jgi:hypothetical protein
MLDLRSALALGLIVSLSACAQPTGVSPAGPDPTGPAATFAVQGISRDVDPFRARICRYAYVACLQAYQRPFGPVPIHLRFRCQRRFAMCVNGSMLQQSPDVLQPTEPSTGATAYSLLAVEPQETRDTEKELLLLINEFRMNHSLPTLKEFVVLRDLALVHNLDMIARGTNVTPDIKPIADRLRAANVIATKSAESASRMGAVPYPAVLLLTSTYLGLLRPTELPYLLDDDYNSIGIGVTRSTDGHVYATTIFAKL